MIMHLFASLLAAVTAAVPASASQPAFQASGPYAKAPGLGIHIGTLPPGANDAITDVEGVRVGHVTHIEGQGKLMPGKGPVRTGVTAIIPRADIWHRRMYAAAWPLNGNGEMTGTMWINESGWLEVPIVLTDTLSVGRVDDGVISWMIKQYPGIGNTEDVPLPVVAEVNDDFLNDQAGRHNVPADAGAALDAAASGPVAQGGVGAGTGAVALAFKGGIGTASRVLPASDGGYTVGVLVNINTYGRREDFRIDGVPVGAEIKDLQPLEPHPAEGSIIMIVATDAPLLHDQLLEICKRAALGYARTGGSSREGSGDLILAFSTANVVPYGQKSATYTPTALDRAFINPLFVATIEATDEAIVNALLAAQTMTGRDGNTVYALPHDRVLEIMHRYGR
ncbi:MAG TPA: P1 family peptidase [Candidatus Eremiobacteraceae bacterium]|jgi:D-aminopeptidase|nr:P1 family peptidase [Candidatus Eremiobacteraceae bacterium]